MVDYKLVKKIWQTKKTDLLPFFVTFCLCLYDIATGIMCGILAALLLLIYRLVVPRIDARQQEVTVIKINGGLTYVGIEYLISKIEEVRLCVVYLLSMLPAQSLLVTLDQ
jgi:MFS superfamily sulfate permease-like transporter